VGVEVEVEVEVVVSSEADIVRARQQGRALALQAGFTGTDLALIATAISEASRNIIEYAKKGEVFLRIIHQGGTKGLSVEARDRGPGIPDIALAMQDGYSSGKGLGMGLPGMRRLMDEFEISSKVGSGTTVKMRKWTRTHA
jgi:serine/threonine-protein kinase RsbT